MNNPMRTRIAAHLDAMGLKPSSQPIKIALKAVGLNETYLYQFMSGRKNTIAPKSLPALAKALNISVGLLDGSEYPVNPTQIKVGGVCEEGAWRAPKEPKEAAQSWATYLPDSRISPELQVAYLVRGNHAAGLGIAEGSIIIVGQGLPPRVGEIVLIERSRDDGMREVLLRKQETNQLEAASSKFTESIIGTVLLSIKRF